MSLAYLPGPSPPARIHDNYCFEGRHLARAPPSPASQPPLQAETEIPLRRRRNRRATESGGAGAERRSWTPASSSTSSSPLARGVLDQPEGSEAGGSWGRQPIPGGAGRSSGRRGSGHFGPIYARFRIPLPGSETDDVGSPAPGTPGRGGARAGAAAGCRGSGRPRGADAPHAADALTGDQEKVNLDPLEMAHWKKPRWALPTDS